MCLCSDRGCFFWRMKRARTNPWYSCKQLDFWRQILMLVNQLSICGLFLLNFQLDVKCSRCLFSYTGHTRASFVCGNSQNSLSLRCIRSCRSRLNSCAPLHFFLPLPQGFHNELIFSFLLSPRIQLSNRLPFKGATRLAHCKSKHCNS